MGKTEIRRTAIIEAVADHLLQHGLSAASLRQMADSAKTSDRMLLHYFPDKDTLVTAALDMIVNRLLAMMDASRPTAVPLAEVPLRLRTMMGHPDVRPYLRLWIEMLPMAQAKTEPYAGSVTKICHSMHAWVCRLTSSDEGQEAKIPAALIYVFVEGILLMDALGCPDIADTAIREWSIPSSSGRPRPRESGQ